MIPTQSEIAAMKGQISTQPLTDDEEIYKENIIDHYKYPHNKKELMPHTIKHKELNPLCGDEITLYLQITNNTIQAATFQGDGCAISQASISMLTDSLKGATIEQAKNLNHQDILNLLGIPISHTRMKCALLSLKTLHKSLEELQC